MFFFQCDGHYRDLHSFPTRRSSDLVGNLGEASPRPGSDLPAGRSSGRDRKSTRLNSSHVAISYAVFCLKKKKMYVRNLNLNMKRVLTQGDVHLHALSLLQSSEYTVN